MCRCDGASRCVKLDWPLAQSNFIHLDAAIPPKEYVFHANSPETITPPVAVSHLPPLRQRYCVKPPNDAHPNQLRVEEKFETPTFEPTVNGPCRWRQSLVPFNRRIIESILRTAHITSRDRVFGSELPENTTLNSGGERDAASSTLSSRITMNAICMPNGLAQNNAIKIEATE